MDASKLSALLVSHICHDLSSPASSISMMLEARKDPDMAKQAEDIIVKSAAALEHKVTFLRYALGSVGLQEGEADPNELASLTRNFLSHHKLETAWNVEAPLSFGQARLLMNMAMIASSTLSRGGKMTLSAASEGDGVILTVHGEGPRVRVGDVLLSALQGNEPEGGWNARNVQPYFTRMIAADLGGALSFEHDDAKVELTSRVGGLV